MKAENELKNQSSKDSSPEEFKRRHCRNAVKYGTVRIINGNEPRRGANYNCDICGDEVYSGVVYWFEYTNSRNGEFYRFEVCQSCASVITELKPSSMYDVHPCLNGYSLKWEHDDRCCASCGHQVSQFLSASKKISNYEFIVTFCAHCADELMITVPNKATRCNTCHDLMMPNCTKCGKPISGYYYSTKTGHYHHDCLPDGYQVCDDSLTNYTGD